MCNVLDADFFFFFFMMNRSTQIASEPETRRALEEICPAHRCGAHTPLLRMSAGAWTGCRPAAASGVKRPARCCRWLWLGSSAGGPTAPYTPPRRDPTPDSRARTLLPCRSVDPVLAAGRPPATARTNTCTLLRPPSPAVRRRGPESSGTPSSLPPDLPAVPWFSRLARRGARKLIRSC